MSGKWICKHCGGTVRLIEYKEYLLNEDGEKIEEDIIEAPRVHQCTKCGKRAHILGMIAEWQLKDSE